MDEVVLAGGGPRVSRFIFGTASLFNVGLQPQRLRLLETAVAQGFTHFDTAPYYGFGASETDLGELLRRHPRVGVTTKVGLYPPGGDAQGAASARLRKAAGRLRPAVSRPMADWSVARARGSLDASLKRLRRERVDLYLLHEPQAEAIASEVWLRWLEDERIAGRVGRFGLAGEVSVLAAFVTGASPLADVLQARDSLDGREADALTRLGRTPQITYGYAAAALRDGRRDMDAVLRASAAYNPAGAIVVSTRRVERVGQWAALIR